MRNVLRLGSVALALSLGIFAEHASADPVWIGDFETGDLSQWEGQLHGEHITIVDSPVIQGASAAKIQLTNDAVWPNGLKRVELHHSPLAARTAEGSETYFAWSFYLPETLPTDPSQEIGYWESDQSYQQMMAFDVSGEHITFATRHPQNVEQWSADGAVTAGTWHRIALHVKWSKDAAQGYVDVWYDGTEVVTQAGAQTLADDNPHFTQVGLLRGAVEFTDSPVIYIDDAVEGDSIADVHPGLPTGTGGAGGGTSTASVAASSSMAEAASSSAATGAGAGGSGVDGATDGANECGCVLVGRRADGSSATACVVMLGSILWSRRTRRRSKSR